MQEVKLSTGVWYNDHEITLTFTDAGATADLIRSTGASAVFGSSGVEGIKHFIHQSMRNGNSLIQNDCSHILNKFDRKSLIQKLIDDLDRICTL